MLDAELVPAMCEWRDRELGPFTIELFASLLKFEHRPTFFLPIASLLRLGAQIALGHFAKDRVAVQLAHHT